MGIKTNRGSHAICLIKIDRQPYLFDPNYGLVKFSLETAVKGISEFLKKFYPEVESHYIYINQVSKR